MQTFLMFTMRWCSDKNSRKKKKSFKLLFSKNCACQSSLVEHSEGVATWMRTERQVTHWQCVCLSKWLAAYFFLPMVEFLILLFSQEGKVLTFASIKMRKCTTKIYNRFHQVRILVQYDDEIPILDTCHYIFHDCLPQTLLNVVQ